MKLRNTEKARSGKRGLAAFCASVRPIATWNRRKARHFKKNKSFILTTYQPVGMLIGKGIGMITDKPNTSAKTRLLDAALSVIRTQGYSATTVDDLCRAAGVTKGGFFHHFESKEALAISAAGHFSSMADNVFSTAPYRDFPDPLDRLLGYVDFRKAILQGELPEYTCLLGTMVQEAYETHPGIREACEKGLDEHLGMLEADIAEAMRKYVPDSGWTAGSLALHMQAVIQGAFIFAKAKGGPEVAAACLDHLRRYLELLFNPSEGKAAA
jgi:TetR/AcrR family transcriptional repressor of nem operon